MKEQILLYLLSLKLLQFKVIEVISNLIVKNSVSWIDYRALEFN